jgi:A/G-specific adenine glycosylase
MTIPQFQKKILSWYKTHGRDLPWRRTKDPYKILVSEIMLQQTQIARVIPKYKEFLQAFPTFQALAKTPNKKLLKVWAGLGYWRRALFLKETAKIICGGENKLFKSWGVGAAPRAKRGEGGKRFGKVLFSKPEDLEKLPGIGHYTARALACFAFGNKEAFLDTNIRRVYLHFFFPSTRPELVERARSGQVSQKVSDKEILPIAQKALTSITNHGMSLTYHKITSKEWHYALFDYGATVLKSKGINKRSKHYHKQSKFEGSFRSFRTKVVKFLLERKGNKAAREVVEALLKNSPYPAKEIISSLLKDKLVKCSRGYYSL